jgi:hypothetical protein
MKIDIKVDMSLEEYEQFLEKNLPTIYKIYTDLVNIMKEDTLYDERTIKSMVLSQVIPWVNEEIEKARKKVNEGA